MTPERAEFAPLNHRFGLYLGLYRSLVYSRVTGASSCMLLLRLVCLRLYSGGRVERTRSTLSMLAALRRARSRERVTAFRSRFVGLERFLDGRGLILERTAVGDRYVVEAMRAKGSMLAPGSIQAATTRPGFLRHSTRLSKAARFPRNGYSICITASGTVMLAGSTNTASKGEI